MEQSTLVWLLSGSMGVVLTVAAFLGKTIFSQVLKKLDSIIDELRNLTKVTITQEEQIRNIRDVQVLQSSKIRDHDNELIDHSERILKLEITTNN